MKFSFEGTEEEWESFCYSLKGESIGKLLAKRTEDIHLPLRTRPWPPSDKPDLNLIKEELPPLRNFEEIKKGFTDHQLRGKENLIALVKMWIINLGVENSEQPNRAEYITEMSKDGKHCGSVISYAMACGGLTKAVDNCFKAMPDMPDGYSPGAFTPEFIRKVAGNIAQVTSILLPPLAQQYELKNPLQRK